MFKHSYLLWCEINSENASKREINSCLHTRIKVNHSVTNLVIAKLWEYTITYWLKYFREGIALNWSTKLQNSSTHAIDVMLTYTLCFWHTCRWVKNRPNQNFRSYALQILTTIETKLTNENSFYSLTYFLNIRSMSC